MTASERQRRRKTRHSDPAPFLLIVAGALFGMLALILIVGVTYVAAIAEKVPPLDKLTPITQGQASQVYYDDGSEIGLLKSTILRQPVSGSQIPAYLREATVSIEDQRFYQHGAIDYLSLARAALTDLTAGQTLQGGSTITMQLVRNLYLADDKSFSYKIKEAVIAERLEQSHSKAWILNSYLNTVPYATVASGPLAGQTAGACRRPPGPSSTIPPATTTWCSRRCWPACRRRPATTTPSSTRRRRRRGATRCWRRWRSSATSAPRRRRPPSARRSGRARADTSAAAATTTSSSMSASS